MNILKLVARVAISLAALGGLVMGIMGLFTAAWHTAALGFGLAYAALMIWFIDPQERERLRREREQAARRRAYRRGDPVK